jgi:hypothetical protein
MLEDRRVDAAWELTAARLVLERHACPTIEWQIRRRAAAGAGVTDGDEARRALLARAANVVRSLADGIRQPDRQDACLRSAPVRGLT